MDIKIIKQYELNILLYIDSICKKNNINYYLCGGTLLGAIRHKGFIPWDDDIDIFIPREDYEKLLEIIIKDNCRYKVVNSKTTKSFYLPFTKVVDSTTFLKEKFLPEVKELGIFVDVFPIDGVPENKHLRKVFYGIILFFRKMVACKVNSGNINHSKVRLLLRYIIKIFLLPVKLESLVKVINQISSIYSFKSSKFVAALTGSYGLREVLEKEKVFGNKKEVYFQNNKFYAPIGFDIYLKQIYGDYMLLPPIEKRKSHHFIEKCYVKDLG